MPDTTPGDGAGPASTPDLGVAAYLEARSHAEDAVVRAAFDDLRERVRAEVKPPPVGLVVRRARRARALAARSRVAVAAAAAVLVMGTAVTLVSRGPGTDDATTVATDGAASRSAAAAPPTTDAPVTPTTSAPVATATKTLVVTVTPPAAPRTGTRTRTPSGTRTSAAPGTTGSAAAPPPQPSSSGPSTEVTVYLWQGTSYPACLSQYAVTRRVPGTGGWESAVRAALAGATADERARGYVSPFGPGVQAEVDEGTHTVDFSSRAVISDTVPGCRTSLDQLVSRTAVDAGHSADVRLEGSAVTWLTWKLGLG